MSQARKMTLRADAISGSILITMPCGVSRERALCFLEGQKHWVEQRVAQWPVPRPFFPNHTIPVDGQDRTICWDPRYSRVPELQEEELLVGGPQDLVCNRIQRFLQARALKQLTEQSHILAQQYDLPLTRVLVKDPRSRWGSCNSKGQIHYSWRLILAPSHVRQYVVAHEVAHLRHFNHSPDFWAFVREIFKDDAQSAKSWLRKNGAMLHAVGKISSSKVTHNSLDQVQDKMACE